MMRGILPLLKNEVEVGFIIIDARRVFDPSVVKAFGFRYYGLGYGFKN
jgi:hypothetical protein